VVEDDPVFRDIVRDIVNSNFTSIAVLEAQNGLEALAGLRLYSPDLVFMDIQLPKTNGLQLAKQLKAVDPHVHITVLTNHDNPEYREAARECGVNHFVSKASSVQTEVVKVIRSTLKSKSL
jgi:DNA-binding NarL/FixJ family response regulator